jgi:hypothetical protein
MLLLETIQPSSKESLKIFKIVSLMLPIATKDKCCKNMSNISNKEVKKKKKKFIKIKQNLNKFFS